jgi:Cu+-exporting ATPase
MFTASLNLEGLQAILGQDASKDPVCGMQLDPQNTAASSIHNDRVYGFCSQGCKQEFDANPEKYASK